MDKKYLTFITSTIFLLSFCTEVTSECIQNSACSCVLPDGSSYDFSSLAKQGPLNFTDGNITFWFQPCKDVILSNKSVLDGCNKPVSLCTWNKGDSSQKGPVSLGNLTESKLKLNPDHEQILTLVYKHKTNTTNINLICSPIPNSPSALIKDSPSNDPSITNLRLISPDVCKHQREEGISGGSVFFILLLVVLGVYFIGGALALKFLRGATGWEMLPNHTFWCALGKQVKIGFMFLCSGCKEDSYERI